MSSLIDIIKEEAREFRTNDDQFFVKSYYAFVLNGPPLKGPLGPMGYAVFPLPVNPQDFTYSLPFASEITPLQQGGVISEEAGICIGEISLDASMGFRPKRDLSTGLGAGDGDFTGLMGTSGGYFDDISGQMHFWRLANRCFDAYSALKKDPESAHKTSMEFHSLKDQLHLEVVPREFVLHRNAGKERVSYRLSCRLAVVGPAGKITIISPDKGLIAKIKDTISQIRAGVQAIAAVIDDVTAALDEIRREISSVVSILDDVSTVINSFSGLIDGTKKFLDIPRHALVSLAGQIEAIANVAAGIAGWPADAVQCWRDLEHQMHALNVAGTTYFKESWNRQVERYRRLANGEPVEIGTRQFPGLQSTPGKGDTTSSVAEIFGGGEKPGDTRRAANVLDEGRILAQQYQGFNEKVVGHGDTLPSLAAKHLGDARKWLDLAIVNDLKPPYITDRANIPGTLRVGDKILIPVASPQTSPDTITTGDPEAGSSQAAANLGTDFYMSRLEGRTYGWQIDEAGGSIDVVKVTGIDNFEQAIMMRFETEQGQNILYPSIGLSRAVGAKGTADTFTNIRYQIRAQLLADKRAERLGRLNLILDQDTLVLDADIQPAGYSTLRTIARTLT